MSRYVYGGIDYTKHLICPLAKTVFTEPVAASDGHTYEKIALEEFLEQQEEPVSPKTGEILNRSVIIPNLYIASFLKKVRRIEDDEWTL